MTLSELAALAAKVEGFKRPRRVLVCQGNCRGRACVVCDGPGDEWDNSPAALLMAVAVWNYKKGRDLQTRSWLMGCSYVIKDGDRRGVGELPDGGHESIARAALVALLRANGVEVPGE